LKIDMFTEIQDPRPWIEDHEHRRILQALEQARLADEMGYGCFWLVEHHAGGEFSLSSAPEMMLAAISQHTQRIRLGHSAVLAPFRFNHPIRIAERAAYLDHLSGGRLELGLARSTVPEWRLFNIAADEARDQMQQAFEMIPRMWTEDRFSWKSQYFDIKDISVVPRPYQRPHPPLWQACSSLPSFEQAGRNGVGALGVTLWAPLSQVREWIDFYRQAVRSSTQPVGKFVNDQFTFFEAREAFLQTVAEEEARLKDPAGGGLTGQFLRDQAARGIAPPNRAQILIGRILQGEAVPDDEVFETLSAQDSLIVGSPETCRRKMKLFAELGIDRLMCFQQVGSLPHDKVMKSIRRVGELIPEFDPHHQPR
jgi:alkanesulfonate monooxygenase SsuD/methylene tetrahydromethanopterin reductase-like flavin-dependent oxidoreductase (luciferase family)